MPGEITRLLEAWRAGDAVAGEEVVARTYDELRRLARGYLRRERPGHLLQATGLLHEAYVRLLRTGPGGADTREAFFRLMASEMRRRLIDHARRRLAHKPGGSSPPRSTLHGDIALHALDQRSKGRLRSKRCEYRVRFQESVAARRSACASWERPTRLQDLRRGSF